MDSEIVKLGKGVGNYAKLLTDVTSGSAAGDQDCCCH
jgi:hypothetical protein